MPTRGTRPSGGGSNLIHRAAALIAVRRHEDAYAVVRQRLQSDPGDAAALVMAAIALKGMGSIELAIEAARNAVAAAPEMAGAFQVLGGSLLESGREQEALDAALTAVRLDPANAMCLVVLAQTQLVCGEDATETAAALVSLAPDQPLTHDTLGRLALANSDWQAAEASFRRALALDPDSATSMNNLGVALSRQERSEEAAAAYLRATQMDPRGALWRRNLLRITRISAFDAEADGNLALAAERFRTVRRLALGCGETEVAVAALSWLSRRALAWNQVAQAHELALEAYDHVRLGASPMTRVRALNQLASIERTLGRSTRALELWLESKEICAREGLEIDAATISNNIGGCLMGLGRAAEGLTHYEAALAAYQGLGRANHVSMAQTNIGWVLVELGRLDEARAAWEQCVASMDDSAAPRRRAGPLLGLATLDLERGALVDADRHIAAARRLADLADDAELTLQLDAREAELNITCNHLDRAEELVMRAFDLAWQRTEPSAMAYVLVCAARLKSRRGNRELALEMLAHAHALATHRITRAKVARAEAEIAATSS